MTVRCVRVELVEGGARLARLWAEEIVRRRAEANATLLAEGISIESVFLERIGETDYLVYYIRSADIAGAVEVGQSLTDDIQVYHRKFQKEAWKGGTPLELLLDLDVS